MAAGGGGFTSAFTAFFNVSGNAQEKLDAIRQGSLSLGAGASNAASGLLAVAGSLNRIRIGSDPVNVQIQELRNRMVDLAATGQVSSQRLNNMIKELSVLNTTLGSSSVRILKARDDLAAMSAQLRQTEIAANKAGTRGMNFMEDASDGMALSVRRVSSAMQGFMLGTSLLQGNLTGLAFSLIFLQFSGFLRLSLAMAGVTLAAGGVIKFVQAFVARRKEIREIADSFFIITRNTQAFSVATQRAEEIVAKLNLEQKDQKGVIKAIIAAQNELRSQGIEPTSDRLKLFTSLLLANFVVSRDWKKALEETLPILVDYADGAGNAEDALKDVGGTTPEVLARGAAALDAMVLTTREVVRALATEGVDLSEFNIKPFTEAQLDAPFSELRENLQERITEIARVAFAEELAPEGRFPNLFQLIEGLGKAIAEAAPFEDLRTGAQDAMRVLDEAFIFGSDSAEENLGVGGRMNRATVEFREELLNLIETGELTIPNVEAMIEKYGALSEVFNLNFISRLERIVEALERIEDLDIDFNIDRAKGEGNILPGPGQAPVLLPPILGPDVPPGFLFPGQLGPIAPGSGQGGAPLLITVNMNNPVVRSEDDIKRISSDTIAAIRRATKFSNIGLS